MSDSYDDYCVNRALAERYWDDQEARANFRTEVWTTKDKQEIAIKDMEDSHLFNAYKQSQNGILFREMVLRLFEDKLRSAKWAEAKLKEKNNG